MSRDSLFGERILWAGRPREVSLPMGYRVVAGVAASLSAVALAFAVVVATALHVPVGGLLSFSAWCATVALATWRLPLVLRHGAEYLVTEKHVIHQVTWR